MGLALSAHSPFCQIDDPRAHLADTKKAEPIASYWPWANFARNDSAGPDASVVPTRVAPQVLAPRCKHSAAIRGFKLRLVIPRPLQFGASDYLIRADSLNLSVISERSQESLIFDFELMPPHLTSRSKNHDGRMLKLLIVAERLADCALGEERIE
jgi:hypothetical protein